MPRLLVHKWVWHFLASLSTPLLLHKVHYVPTYVQYCTYVHRVLAYVHFTVHTHQPRCLCKLCPHPPTNTNIWPTRYYSHVLYVKKCFFGLSSSVSFRRPSLHILPLLSANARPSSSSALPLWMRAWYSNAERERQRKEQGGGGRCFGLTWISQSARVERVTGGYCSYCTSKLKDIKKLDVAAVATN